MDPDSAGQKRLKGIAAALTFLAVLNIVNWKKTICANCVCLYVCDLLLVLSVPKLLDGFYKTHNF